MARAKFNENHKQIMDSYLLSIPMVDPGQMYGYPAYYIGSKLFACVFENAVAVKISEIVAEKLLKKDDIVHFQQLGRRKMREWIQINKTKSDDFLQEKDIFDASIKFVVSIVGIKLQKEKIR